MSTPPSRCTVSATAARQLAPSVTSRCTGMAWPPSRSMSAAVAFAPGSSTSAQATRAPAAANASAVARPIPFAAPTTMATFCSSENAASITALRRIEADDLVQAPKPDEERRVGRELDDLALAEVLTQLVPERVIHFVVVDRQLLGEAQRRAL